MAEYERMVKNKRQAGVGIILVGLILGFMAIILDILFTGEANLGQTPLFLMLGGLVISAMGAAYISAGTANAVKKLSKQITVMKHDLNQKDKVIDEQLHTLESLSDTRLKGLSETVDKMDLLAKSRTMTELPTKSEGRQAQPDLDAVKDPSETPKPEGTKSSRWERKKSLKGLPPPPPKPMAGPKGASPQGLPPPPGKMPPKPLGKPSVPPKPEVKPPIEPKPEPAEKIEKVKEEPEKSKVEVGADDVPVMNCPKCDQIIRGKWKECPFCDHEIDMGIEEEDDITPPPEELINEGSPASGGLSILGFPSATPPEGEKDIINEVLDEVMQSTPTIEKAEEDVPPDDDEQEEEEEEEGKEEVEEVEKAEEATATEPPKLDEEVEKEVTATEPPKLEEEEVQKSPEAEPPMVAEPEKPDLEATPAVQQPLITPPAPISTDKGICPNCQKNVKPHWRNCPYCKFALRS